MRATKDPTTLASALMLCQTCSRCTTSTGLTHVAPHTAVLFETYAWYQQSLTLQASKWSQCVRMT